MALQDLLNVFKLLKQDYNSKKSSAAVSLLVKDTIATVKDNNNLESIPNITTDGVTLEVVDNTNQVMLDAYDKMTQEEKLSLLRSAVLYQKNNVLHQESRIKFFKEIESFNLRTWVIKVFVSVILLAIVGFSSAFIYVMIKHGTTSDMSIISSLFKTLQEVLSIIFLTNAN
jgi:hypothetical protein